MLDQPREARITMFIYQIHGILIDSGLVKHCSNFGKTFLKHDSQAKSGAFRLVQQWQVATLKSVVQVPGLRATLFRAVHQLNTAWTWNGSIEGGSGKRKAGVSKIAVTVVTA